jgi:hypothetical protein
MARSGLIICERSGDWAIALRRALQAAGLGDRQGLDNAPGNQTAAGKITLHETRSPAECLALLDDFATAVVAVELTFGNANAVLEMLTALDRRSPRFVTIALVSPALEIDVSVLRECGAVHVVRSFVEAPAVIDITERHLTRRELSPQQNAEQGSPSGSLREEIWQRLPWGP